MRGHAEGVEKRLEVRLGKGMWVRTGLELEAGVDLMSGEELGLGLGQHEAGLRMGLCLRLTTRS